MNRIDDANLLIPAPKKTMLFVGDDCDRTVREVGLAIDWRDGKCYPASHALGARLRQIRMSPGLPDFDKARHSVEAYNKFDAVTAEGRKVLAKINDGIAERTAALVPPCKPVWEIDAQTMQLDMQLIAVADQWDGDRVRSFLVQLASGEPMPVRIAEALVRVGPSLCKNLAPSFIDSEVKRELSDFRNADKLDGLRQARIIGSRVERSLNELEAASRMESAIDRRTVDRMTLSA